MISKPEPTEPSQNKDGNEPKGIDSNAITSSKIEPTINSELRVFVDRIDSLVRTLSAMNAVLHLVEMQAAKQASELLKEAAVISGDKRTLKADSPIPAHLYPGIRKLTRRIDITKEGKVALSRSYLTSLISHYDAYFGRLIKALYVIRPELLNSSDKTIPFQQLTSFGSIEDAREYLIEKEIDTVLRGSHTDQMRWIEKKLKIRLIEDWAVWPKFVEVTERRNLFVHTGGIVSSQYLKVCDEHDVDFSADLFSGRPVIGSELAVSRNYFDQAYEAVFEVGFKLAHIVWRKLQPKDKAAADKNLTDITYNLISEKYYGLAIVLLDFASTQVKVFSSDEARRRLVINRVQAYKWKGYHDKAMEILNTEDWTATSDQFQLAVAALRDDFSLASKIMVRIGPENDKVSKEAYHDWPLFQKFRETDTFTESYKKVFNEEFTRALPSSERDLLETLDILEAP